MEERRNEGSTMKEERGKCEHFTVRRVLDLWKCIECGQEFVPKRKKGTQ